MYTGKALTIEDLAKSVASLLARYDRGSLAYNKSAKYRRLMTRSGKALNARVIANPKFINQKNPIHFQGKFGDELARLSGKYQRWDDVSERLRRTKKLAAIGNMVKGIVRKGFNPDARRSFGSKHIPSKDRLPSQIKDRTLFPDAPTDKHKQQTAPGNKGSGVSDLNAKLPYLRHTVEQLKHGLNEAIKIFSNLQDMRRKSGQLGGGLKDQGTIAIIKDKKRQWDGWMAELEDYLPDDGDTVSQKYDDLLSEGLNTSRALEDAVDDINRVCKDLGATV